MSIHPSESPLEPFYCLPYAFYLERSVHDMLRGSSCIYKYIIIYLYKDRYFCFKRVCIVPAWRAGPLDELLQSGGAPVNHRLHRLHGQHHG